MAKQKKSVKTAIDFTPEVPVSLESRVDMACKLLLDVFEKNDISKSEAVSSMATLIASILAQYDDDSHFETVISMMQSAFKESR